MIDLNLFDFLIKYSEVNIRNCASVVHDKNWYEASSQISYDIWIITDGKVKITMKGKNYILNEYDTFLFYPNQLYFGKSLTETCEFIYIHFDFTIGENMRGLDDFPLYGRIPSSVAPKDIKNIIIDHKNYIRKEPMSLFSLKGNMIVFLSKVIKYKVLETDLPTSNKWISNKLSRLHESFKYISANINKPISIAELADIAGMSEKYYITFFKNAVGITPAKYITQMKMNKALDLIYEQYNSIKQISEILGYSDQYTFSKAFSKFYNIAPSKILGHKHLD